MRHSLTHSRHEWQPYLKKAQLVVEPFSAVIDSTRGLDEDGYSSNSNGISAVMCKPERSTGLGGARRRLGACPIPMQSPASATMRRLGTSHSLLRVFK